MHVDMHTRMRIMRSVHGINELHALVVSFSITYIDKARTKNDRNVNQSMLVCKKDLSAGVSCGDVQEI
jgi:hypothetical protein